MSLILHDYVILLSKQSPTGDGFSYKKADIDLKDLTEDEIHKLWGEAKFIAELLEADIIRRNWKT